MKKLLFAGLVMMLFSSSLFASWNFIALDELVKDSDLIVVGTLQNVSEYTKDDYDYGEGEILIDQVVSGNIKSVDGYPLRPTDKIQLKWRNWSAIACPRVEHRYHANQKFIWLLTVENVENVQADYPGRAVSLDNLSEVQKLVKKFRQKEFKVLKKLEDKQNIQLSPVEERPVPQICGFDFANRKRSEYSPLAALVVIGLAGFLYYILYWSKFKIR